MSEDNKLIMDELARAHAEGEFRGKVLAYFEDIMKRQQRLEDSIASVTSKVDTKATETDLKALEAKAEQKVDKAAIAKIEEKVDWILKVTWMGLGGLAVLQIVIGYLLTKI